MLLDYHSFYGQESQEPVQPTPVPTGGGAWLPKKKVVTRRSRATASVDVTLPLLDIRLRASVKPQPKTRARVRLTLPALQSSISAAVSTQLTLDASLVGLQSVVTGAQVTVSADVTAVMHPGELRGALRTSVHADVDVSLPLPEAAALTTARLSAQDQAAQDQAAQDQAVAESENELLIMAAASVLLDEYEAAADDEDDEDDESTIRPPGED